ncbi:isomerase [Hahella sp. CCB-MM4]|uniref:PhzF family phenazine biosynthesis protein n=1 Tax=Hahella sp. (strain CCB-MM4) TaxID=1926491 RepID=UPI000B9C2D79|nr:PhzF family phenazine biosynthesis protein [Hahella sp. CCB-MM4]OZG73549.1 isomerase [Hahella sp. CCB-MM4]
MKITMYQVDAFATRQFEGNPAAVCPLEAWPEDHLLQAIAEENNLSETAFFVISDSKVELRWFTPEAEVDLCGHATLAAAHVLFTHMKYPAEEIVFSTRSGNLHVKRSANGYSMDFPASVPENTDIPEALLRGLGAGVKPKAILAAFDYIVVLDSEEQVGSLQPDFADWLTIGLRGVIVTARGRSCDFVSRAFFPKLRVNEDPVTGSAHCELVPYWARELDKECMTARQLSKRGGTVNCELRNDRVVLTGSGVDFMRAEVDIEF